MKRRKSMVRYKALRLKLQRQQKRRFQNLTVQLERRLPWHLSAGYPSSTPSV
jgi:hypothetical protein